MKYKCFSVYDSKVGLYHPFMFFRTKGEAIRAFSDAVNNKDNLIGKYPEDFSFFETGDWCDETCVYSPLPTPVSIARAHEFLPVQEQSDKRER